MRVHFLVHAPDGLPEIANAELEREVVQLARTWDDALRDALVERHGAARAAAARSIWADAPARALQGLHVAGDAARWTSRCSSSLAEDGAVRGLAAAAAPSTPAVALYVRGPKVELGDALPMLEDLGLRVIEEISTRLVGRGRDVGAGVPRARPRRRAAGHRGARRPRRGAARRRPSRRRRDRQPQPAGDHRRAGPPPGGDPARVPQVPPAGRLALHRELPERRARGQLRRSPRSSCATSSCASTRDRRDRRGGRGGAARRDPRRPRRGRLARPRPHPAQPADGDRRDAAHERLQRRPRGAGVQAALGRRPGDAAARAAFEIYVYSPEVEGIHLRGGPIARGGLRWSRPPGLPHRGLRPDAGAADQERGDRAGGRQGRLQHQAPAERPRRAQGRGREPVRHLHPLAARR